MYVVGPGQGYQHADIQQSGQGKSSSALYTSSLVMGLASGSTSNVPRLLLTPVPLSPLNPRRANSDTALPRLVFLRCASARATDNTSSSRVSVVRIATSSHLIIMRSMYPLPPTPPLRGSAMSKICPGVRHSVNPSPDVGRWGRGPASASDAIPLDPTNTHVLYSSQCLPLAAPSPLSMPTHFPHPQAPK